MIGKTTWLGKHKKEQREANKNAAQQTLKDDSSSPLYICYAAFYSQFNLRVVGGKLTDALWRISALRRQSTMPKYPLTLLGAPDLKEPSGQ